MRIDSHQHYWKVNRGDYHWMTPSVPVLCRDYLPSDLRPLLQQHGIDRTILVQAAQTADETDFLLDLAAREPTVAGVVGWLDLDSPGFPQEFENRRKHPSFVGIRPMLQDIADDRWILRPQVMASLRILAEADFPFDFCIYPRHLPSVIQVLEAVPGLRATIDHLSKPEIRAHNLHPWKSLIAEVARHRNVFCKLSGMITEADHERWSVPDLQPYVDHAMECFGPDRVMFGSDWPVCLKAGSYHQVIHALRELLSPAWIEAAEQKIFGLNALRFYKLAPKDQPAEMP